MHFPLGLSEPINARIPLYVFVWIYDTFENTSVIENDFTKYLKESCGVGSVFIPFLFQIFSQLCFCLR